MRALRQVYIEYFVKLILSINFQLYIDDNIHNIYSNIYIQC